MTGPSGSDLDRLREDAEVVVCDTRLGPFVSTNDAAVRVRDGIAALDAAVRVERERANDLGAMADRQLANLRARASAAETTLNRIEALLPKWLDERRNGHGSRRDGLRMAIDDLTEAFAVLDSKETTHD